MTHSPGKIGDNCRYFLMTFRTQIHKKKFGKNGFHTLQGTMSHRPLTNTSGLKITAAYWTGSRAGSLALNMCLCFHCPAPPPHYLFRCLPPLWMKARVLAQHGGPPA
jgi:hypothetical protein